MNLLVAHPSAELYGADRQLLESVTAFADSGARVTVVLPGHGELDDRLRDIDSVDVVAARFPVLRKAALRPHLLLWLLLTTPVAVLRIARLIAKIAPDVVYVNTVTLPHWVLAARVARRRVIVHVHEAEAMSSPAVRRGLYAPLLAAHNVVANSESTAELVTRSWPRLSRSVTVVPNGVPDAGAADAQRSVGGRLVLVSRLSPRKGVDVALEALARVRTAGHDVSLTLCGSTFEGYEWFETQLRERASRPDLAGRVTFAGFVDPVHDALAEAEIVLMPSLGESFGNAAVEGMLAARAVVASDVQGLAEIITDGTTGLLVPPGDAAALADAITRLLDDPQLRDRLARDGRQDAVSRFSTPRYHRQIVAAAGGTDNYAAADSAESAESVEAVTGRPEARRVARLAAVGAGVAVCALVLAGCSGSNGSNGSDGSDGSASATPSPTAQTSSAPGTSANSSAGSTGASAAPGSGSIGRTVASQRVTTQPAVGLTGTARFGDGVALRVVAHSRITGKANRPGEIAGPAIKLTLRLTNNSNRTIDVDDAVVTVTDSRKAPLSRLSTQTAAFRGRLAVGRSADGTYVFSLQAGSTNPYTIAVSYSGRSAVVQLVGDAA